MVLEGCSQELNRSRQAVQAPNTSNPHAAVFFQRIQNLINQPTHINNTFANGFIICCQRCEALEGCFLWRLVVAMQQIRQVAYQMIADRCQLLQLRIDLSEISERLSSFRADCLIEVWRAKTSQAWKSLVNDLTVVRLQRRWSGAVNVSQTAACCELNSWWIWPRHEQCQDVKNWLALEVCCANDIRNRPICETHCCETFQRRQLEFDVLNLDEPR